MTKFFLSYKDKSYKEFYKGFSEPENESYLWMHSLDSVKFWNIMRGQYSWLGKRQ